MAVSVALEALRGRDEESGRVESLLDGARAGRSDVLVLRGEAGIGKSALLRHAVAAAGEDMPVLPAVGLESESDLAFAGLHQLLRPVLDAPRVACPARRPTSVRRAFGLADGPIDNPFLISLATLTLLVRRRRRQRPAVRRRRRALARPLLRGRAAVRRTPARRGGHRAAAGRPRRGPPEAALRAAARAAARRPRGRRRGARCWTARSGSTPAVRARLLDVARRQPARAARAPRLPHAARSSPGACRSPSRCRSARASSARSSAGRAGCRTPPRRCCSSSPPTTPSRCARCATRRARLGIDDRALDELEEARLVVVDGTRITFRHPLVRSAVYRSAISRERRTRAPRARGGPRRRGRPGAPRVASRGGRAGPRRRDRRRPRRRRPPGAPAGRARRGRGDVRARGAADDRRRLRGRKRLLDAARGELALRAARTASSSSSTGPARCWPTTPTRPRSRCSHGSCALERGALADGFRVLMDGARRALVDTRPDSRCGCCCAPARRRGGRATPPGRTRSARSPPASTWTPDARIHPRAARRQRAAAARRVRGGRRRAAARRGARARLDGRTGLDERRRRGAVPRRRGRRPGALRPRRRHPARAGCDRRAALRAVPDRGDGARRRPLRATPTPTREESLRLAVETRQETDRCYVLSLLASIAAVRGATEECEAKAGEALEAATAPGLGAASHHARWALGRLELGHGRPGGGARPPAHAGGGRRRAADAARLAARIARRRGGRGAGRAAARRPRRARALRELGHAPSARCPGRRSPRGCAGCWPRTSRRPTAASRRRSSARSRPAPAVRAGAHPPASTASTCGAHAAGSTPARTCARRRPASRRSVRPAGRSAPAAELRASGETSRRAGADAPVQLTPQELQIARYVIEGASNREVAVPALREPADGRAPPEQDLLQARHQLTRRARAGARRARAAAG